MTRHVAGLVGSVMLLLSSVAHSVLGWPELRAPLEALRAPEDLIAGLAIGWYFGGLAMLVFGLIAVDVFRRALRGEAVSLTAPLLIAVAYLAFGGWAIATTGDPFFMVFIVPGVLLGWASAPRGRA